SISSELGFTDEQERILQRVISKPSGAVIMSGSTDSGKSTTDSLPTVLRIMNKLVKLKYPDGTTDWKREGEMLPGGYQLSTFSVTGVWVKSIKDNKKSLLKNEAN
ncbi:hypothetical protein NAD28_004624, partial [Salmonella enterica]|nr:hypothetical protein [Salmonella enterica]